MFAKHGAVIYGTLTIGALLAAESARSETYPETIAAVGITLLVYWLAHAYSALTANRLAQNERLTARSLTRTLKHESTIIVGAAIPLVVLIVYWATGARLADAVNAAIWTSAVMIVVIEVVAGLRARLSGRELVAQAALGTLFGLLVISLRLVLH